MKEDQPTAKKPPHCGRSPGGLVQYTVPAFLALSLLFRIDLVCYLAWASTAPVSYIAVYYVVVLFEMCFLHRVPYFSWKVELHFLLMYQVFLNSGP